MRRRGIPWFRFGRVGRGTVYLMQSRDMPDLYKVGFTKRKTTTRRAEINRVSGDDMRIVATVAMPLALKCEALVLRRLRRNPLRKRDRRGTEWFYLRPREEIQDIADRIERAADRVELIARLKCSWPKGVKRRVWRLVSTAMTGRLHREGNTYE